MDIMLGAVSCLAWGLIPDRFVPPVTGVGKPETVSPSGQGWRSVIQTGELNKSTVKLTLSVPSDSENLWREKAIAFMDKVKLADTLKTSESQSFYRGYVSDMKLERLSMRWGSLTVTFTLSPPVRFTVLSRESIDFGSPVCEQITEYSQTAGKTFYESGSLEYASASVYPAESYIRVTGSFESLRVGSLNLAYQTPQSMDVYIDCENQTVYHRLGGTMTSLMSLVSGDFPEITSSGSLEISGSGLNLSVRMLIVERS